MRTEVICYAKDCGKHLRWIDTPYGGVSSGYCKKHFKEAMQKADDAFRRDEDLRAERAQTETLLNALDETWGI